MNTDAQVDQILGQLLRAGVVLATAVVLVGGVIHLLRHGGDPRPDFQTFHSEPTDLRSITGVGREVTRGSGRGIVQLGVLLLIATPIARVIFSIGAFTWQRDWLYVGVTVVVLVVLLYGLIA